nr:FunD [Talaromyces coalescens]
MVALSDVVAHNNCLRQRPSGLIALFVGATSGIGLSTLRTLAERLPGSRLYVVGRSKERFASELSRLERLNDCTEIIFIEAEIALLKNTNKIVKFLSNRESKLDLLYMSPGSSKANFLEEDTDEGLDICMSLSYYTRIHLVQGLIALLLSSPNPRVLSVLAGGHEKYLFTTDGDLGLRNPGNYDAIRAVDQLTTLHSLAFAHLASLNPKISFLHVHPGWVATGFLSNLLGSGGMTGRLLEIVVSPLYRLIAITVEESGARQAFHATSAMYPSRELIRTAQFDVNSCAVCHTMHSGFYLVGPNGDTASANSFLAQLLDDGWANKVWKYTENVFQGVLVKD